MNIRGLEIFLHLSQSLHFVETASAMHTTPSTLSRQIQRLEIEVGELLFERDNRQVKLTAAGHRYREFAELVISQWAQLKSDLAGEGQQLSGEITIFCTVTAAHLYLPQMLEKLRRLHPLIDIHLETGDVANAFRRVSDKSVDFAFAVAPEKLASRFAFQHLYQIPFKLIAPKQSVNFSKYLKTANIQWQQLPFVMPESGPALLRLKNWLTKMQIKPKIKAQVLGHEAIVSMTALGCGVSAVPLPVLENSPVKDKVQILPVPFAPEPFDLGMVCLRNRLETPVIHAFWQIVMEEAGQIGAVSY